MVAELVETRIPIADEYKPYLSKIDQNSSAFQNGASGKIPDRSLTFAATTDQIAEKRNYLKGRDDLLHYLNTAVIRPNVREGKHLSQPDAVRGFEMALSGEKPHHYRGEFSRGLVMNLAKMPSEMEGYEAGWIIRRIIGRVGSKDLYSTVSTLNYINPRGIPLMEEDYNTNMIGELGQPLPLLRDPEERRTFMDSSWEAEQKWKSSRTVTIPMREYWVYLEGLEEYLFQNGVTSSPEAMINPDRLVGFTSHINKQPFGLALHTYLSDTLPRHNIFQQNAADIINLKEWEWIQSAEPEDIDLNTIGNQYMRRLISAFRSGYSIKGMDRAA